MDLPYSLAELESKLAQLKTETTPLEAKLQDPETLRDNNEYRKVSKHYSELQAREQIVASLIKTLNQYEANQQLQQSETDPELQQLIRLDNETLAADTEQLLASLAELEETKDPLDNGNAIIEIRAGTGGEEAALFAQELFRAYTKFAEQQGFRVSIASLNYTGTGGFKEVIFFVEGVDVYKTFKFESGVHRVQRVPATENSGRIHTSAASVVVLPEIPETEVNIDPKDLRIDVYRAGGPGGQSVNTTDSAVRLVHIPTGIIVTCQDEKSQHKNKAKALKILQAKLYDLAKAEADAKLGNIRQQAIQTGDRSAKIRTYNFPQSRVTDHRIKQSWHNLGEIMEGNFSQVIAALHKYNREHSQTN